MIDILMMKDWQKVDFLLIHVFEKSVDISLMTHLIEEHRDKKWKVLQVLVC